MRILNKNLLNNKLKSLEQIKKFKFHLINEVGLFAHLLFILITINCRKMNKAFERFYYG